MCVMLHTCDDIQYSQTQDHIVLTSGASDTETGRNSKGTCETWHLRVVRCEACGAAMYGRPATVITGEDAAVEKCLLSWFFFLFFSSLTNCVNHIVAPKFPELSWRGDSAASLDSTPPPVPWERERGRAMGKGGEDEETGNERR